MKTKDLLARFMANVTIQHDGTSDCWIWHGARKSDGYGTIRAFGKNTPAHRLSYMLFKGEIPLGLFVCHSCDVKSCVNPTHLWVGTNSDNMRDCVAKGRFHPASGSKCSMYGKKGEACPNSTLTDTAVNSIRREYFSGVSQMTLAGKYGVKQGTISCIIRRKTWDHLPQVENERAPIGNALFTTEQCGAIRERVQSGELQKNIAKELGCSRFTIHRVCKSGANHGTKK